MESFKNKSFRFGKIHVIQPKLKIQCVGFMNLLGSLGRNGI